MYLSFSRLHLLWKLDLWKMTTLHLNARLCKVSIAKISCPTVYIFAVERISKCPISCSWLGNSSLELLCFGDVVTENSVFDYSHMQKKAMGGQDPTMFMFPMIRILKEWLYWQVVYNCIQTYLLHYIDSLHVQYCSLKYTQEILCHTAVQLHTSCSF